MTFTVVPNMIDDECIEKLKAYMKVKNHNVGKVGNRVDPDQKIRYDIFITDKELLNYLDIKLMPVIQMHSKELFGKDIMYREAWKLGYYKGTEGGFYIPHRDTTGLTNYRHVSLVISASDASEYEGGELHFPELGKEFKLGRGEGILFASDTLHGVKPVTGGERVVLISFTFTEEGWEHKAEPKIKSNYTPHVVKE